MVLLSFLIKRKLFIKGPTKCCITCGIQPASLVFRRREMNTTLIYLLYFNC